MSPRVREDVDHRIAFGDGLRPRLGDRLGEQTEAGAELDVLAGEIAGRRGQIVRVDRREQRSAEVLGRLEPAVLVLEPQDGRAQDAAPDR